MVLDQSLSTIWSQLQNFDVLMVLRQRESNIMTSEQPLKKKPKREGSRDSSDEPDFIPNDIASIHLTMPPNVNEDDFALNTVNLNYSKRNSVGSCSDLEKSAGSESSEQNDRYITTPESENVNIPPAPNIGDPNFPDIVCITTSNVEDEVQDTSLNDFQQYLIKQCLCGAPETVVRRPFEGYQNDETMLSEWPTKDIIELLSNIQLLFSIYLKQNNKGFICSKIIEACEPIIHNEYNLIEQIISLCDSRNKFVNFLASRVFSSFLIIAKTNINNEWLETISNFLTTDNNDYTKMNFSLEVVKRVVDWKDVEIHVLEDAECQDIAGSSSEEPVNVNCVKIPFSDPESFDTSAIKGLIIKSLEVRWPEMIHRIQTLIPNNNSVQTQTCILTFLSLWESIISVKANLSVVETKPFNAHLEIFLETLISTANLSPIIWKQILSLFNEVLCYGSTLALQDLLPDDTRRLATLVVRYIKDLRLLDRIPYRREVGFTVNSFVGTISSDDRGHSNVDKTLIQKIVLLALKSAATTIKETRSDSSDSSVGSDDYDFYQDMHVIVNSIRAVLRRVDAFIKSALDFHPETPFSKVMVHLFSDQDDYMIEAMICTLDITVGISYRNAVYPDLMNMLNPTDSFIEFLKIVSHDSDVLLDYLVSNETCFLLYLLRFLKYTRKSWSKFVTTCGEGSTSRNDELDDTMTVLIRLKMQINRLVARELFPYNISPVLRLLEVCENLYEGNEYS